MKNLILKMIELLLELDKQLFLFLNGLHNNFFDWLMHYISYKYTWLPLYAFLLVLIFYRFRWKGFYFILFATLLVFLSDQSSVFIKNTFMRLRPCHEPELEGLVHIVRGKCGGRYGFVSSHAANTFAVAVFVIGLLKSRFQFVIPLMLAYAMLNGYSRIYLGVHYPGDVIFGALLGAGIGYMIYFFWIKTMHALQPIKS
jgi:undecaprenyl-diphosphatase